MPDFLLELRSEEIPARMQEKAAADLARLFADEIARSGLAAAAIETFVTPRRLALIARALPLATHAVREETRGPRTSAPPQALEGFLRKTGLARDALVERDGVLFAAIERPGRATADVLAETVPAIVRGFPWSKSMRWGAASAETTSLRWVRPLQGIVALLGEDVVPFAIEGIASGAATLGHRFHHPGRITFRSAADYADKLRLCHVLVDPEERKAIIRERAAALAAGAGLAVVPDEGLVAENAGLTEWPVPLLGHFDPGFLAVPREVIQLTLGANQKYFVLNDADGKLAPAFLCTADIAAADGGAAIVAGNRKVLSARLSDARFFREQDRKLPLAAHAGKLGDIVFHEKLGTVADKVERVAKLARWLVEEGIVPDVDPAPSTRPFVPSAAEMREADASAALGAVHPSTSLGTNGEGQAGKAARARLADLAEQAARLCKADLVTGMVGEFPELQGVVGSYYARAEGLPDEVADAIRDHYKPVGQGDEVPTAPVTVAVSLAERLYVLAAFFDQGIEPTGSKDPFALRRASLGAIQIIFSSGLRFSLRGTLAQALAATRAGQPHIYEPALPKLLDFFADRLKVQQREAGVRHDLIDAVFALGGEDDLVRLLARVKALQAFVGTREGADLLAGYRRAANILRKEGRETPTPTTSVIPAQAGIHREAGRDDEEGRGGDNPLSHTREKAESDLLAALDAAGPLAARAIEGEDFAGAMAALATLRGPIDAFFETVTVNDPDPVKRAARLALLARIRAAVHQVADFSRIEG